MVRDKYECVICNSTVVLPKKANVERHFQAVHQKFTTEFPMDSEIRNF